MSPCGVGKERETQLMHLVFDLDGTLTDPFEGISKSIEYALQRLGRHPPNLDALRWCVGPPLKASLAKLLEDDALADQALAHYRERFSRVGLFENRVYPGIEEALGSLRAAGHTLRVATSKPTVFAKRILRHFNLAGHFTSIYGSELGGARSDKASLLRHMLERERFSTAEGIMIGDREHDMRAATAVGMARIGVLWGYGSETELLASGAQVLARSPQDLLGPKLLPGPPRGKTPNRCFRQSNRRKGV